MISVCMATYNGENYIKEQLTSILRQLGSEDEVIISDDGSKDNTQKIVESFSDERIRFIENHRKHGFTYNFENALLNAKGEYIFLSDQDDVWMDNKVEVLKRALKEADFVTHDCITVDNNWKVLSKSRFDDFKMKSGFINHLIKSRFLGCCMAFDRKVLEASLPFPGNDFLVEHDIWIAAIAFLYFKTALVKEPLIYYRRHGKNVSSGGFSEGYSAKVKIEKRLYRLLKLAQAYPKVVEIKKGVKK